MDEIAFYIRNRSLFYNARSLPANAPARYLIVLARCPRTLPRTLPTHARCPRTLPRTLPTHAARSLPAHVPPYAPQRNWPQDNASSQVDETPIIAGHLQGRGARGRLQCALGARAAHAVSPHWARQMRDVANGRLDGDRLQQVVKHDRN